MQGNFFIFTNYAHVLMANPFIGKRWSWYRNLPHRWWQAWRLGNIYRKRFPNRCCLDYQNDRQCTKLEMIDQSSWLLTAVVVVDTSTREEGVVFDLGASQSRAVVGDDNQLSLGLSEILESAAVAQIDLSALHDKGETRVDAFLSLLLLVREGMAD